MTLLFTHPAMLAHQGPPGHPEHPGRLAAVLDALEGLALDRREAPLVDPACLARVHTLAYLTALDGLFPTAGQGMRPVDAGDTFVSDGSREAAGRAAGAVVAAVDAVLAGQDRAAFCAVRPPGHHAEPAQAMGFCLYNNVAIGALHALEAHGLSRVAVVDFDVHHGNGTQSVAEGEPRLLFASTHQMPLYPGTGRAGETGIDGNVVNVPLPPGTDGGSWRRVFAAKVLPALNAFAPEALFISAGFDAHTADPLAQLALNEQDFAWGTAALLEAVGPASVVSTLEGGYDRAALAACSAAHVRALARA